MNVWRHGGIGRLALALAFAFALVAPVARGDEKEPDPVPHDPPPTEPGLHFLLSDHEAETDGKVNRMAYGLYLPDNIKQAKADGEKVPMVVYLCGAGSRGLLWSKLIREGPINRIRRDKNLAKATDFIVLHPLVMPTGRWENQEMGEWAAAVTKHTIATQPVDPDRVYLIGSSMGGEGVWHAALAGPELYAVVASFAGRQHPEPDKVAEAVKASSVLIVVGTADAEFTTGSRNMADAFRKVGTDTLLVEIPGRGHGTRQYYAPRVAFYDWLKLHERGAAPPKDRADAEELLNWAVRKPVDPEYHAFEEDMQKQFTKFKKWWWIENSGMVDRVGLHDEYMGEDDVFVTSPLNREMPCRIMFTAELPKNKKTKLKLEVGNEEKSHWLLEVNIDNVRRLRERIPHKKRRNENWHEFEVNLSDLAGKKVFIEILNRSGRDPNDSRALWKRIDLVHE